MSTASELSYIEKKDVELFTRFKRFNDDQKLNILYNWIAQRVITAKLFRQMVGHIIEKELREDGPIK